ncbi:VOC family protein [Roseofilum casamattae]|uniref:VOC family protein n=1 Tax=Roseofilum casamattae BLCC-M143 TaxID=3022442 RepID=A0ABT7C116_9CYAN|nr:VOC family protein [Roseofilum casamattae]MDJ1185147.1 VOC family protein [Roseofilum casamattae BLCC-M143]
MSSILFHLAFPVKNLPETKAFYVDGLGCQMGRESSHALILNLYGHQLVAHVTEGPLAVQKGIYPRHFGLVFPNKSDWDTLLQRAQEKALTFVQQPKRRFPEQLTEHYTFFLTDPFANFLEFKHYCHPEAIFGARNMAEVGDR